MFALLFLVTSFLAEATPASGASTAGNSWEEKAPMPTGRGYLGVAVVNEKIYAIGGGGSIGINEVYDPVADNWTTKSSMPNPTQSFGIAACKGKIYCIGGISSDSTGANRVYDPANNSWETKTSMPTGRYGLLANAVNGKIYCMGGVKLLGYNQGVEPLNVTEVYDPSSNTWTTKSPMPSPEGYVSAVVDNKIYVIGPGLTQIYNPDTDTWSTASPSPTSLTSRGSNGVAAAATATSGTMAPKRIYVYDGSSLQVYNPQNDSWTFSSAPPTSRQYLGIAVVNDLLYFIGGFTYTPPFSYNYYATNEQYTPVGYGTAQEHTPFPLVPVAVSGVSAVVVVGAVVALYFKKRKH